MRPHQHRRFFRWTQRRESVTSTAISLLLPISREGNMYEAGISAIRPAGLIRKRSCIILTIPICGKYANLVLCVVVLVVEHSVVLFCERLGVFFQTSSLTRSVWRPSLVSAQWCNIGKTKTKRVAAFLLECGSFKWDFVSARFITG